MTNAEWAEAILVFYREGAKNGRFLWTYGDMAAATGRKGQHRLMGPALDLVRDMCIARSLPDCAAMVVTQEELKADSIKPSEGALKKHQGWTELRKQQANCLIFNW